MTTQPAEKQLVLRIESPAKANVYLSTSWQPDKGVDLVYRVVRSFDQHSVRVVGDAKDLATQEDVRIRRVMADCDGFLCLLPFRPAQPSTTSPYMLAELRIAVSMGLPIGLLYDERIHLVDTKQARSTALSFGDEGGTIEVPHELLSCLRPYHVDVPASEAEGEAALVSFRERVLLSHENAVGRKIPAYCFLITRLKGDFTRARHAVAAAVERATGLPCIWIDASGYATNISGTVERTRLLIEHAQFVVADLSLSEENPDFDNPSRAHEIGLAVAFQKKLFVTAQEPRRDPYHALSVTQVVFWSDEADLFDRLRAALHAEREVVGRHTYNWELPRLGDSYTPRLPALKYSSEIGSPHVAPSASELGRAESWIIAVCFALIALCASVLLDRYTGFADTFDFAAVVGAAFALTFSSDLNRLLRRQLARSTLLRWAVFVMTALLLLAAIFSSSPVARPSAPQRPAVQPAE